MELIKCEMGHIYVDNESNSCPYCSMSYDNKEKEDYDEIINTVEYIKTDIKKVVAWLVNIEGFQKGMDYRLIEGRNFIGSSIENDVCILGDDNISENNHFSISYDKNEKEFVISPGISGNIVYLNKKALYETKIIENYSLIEISKTKLVFVQFAGNNFSWD